MREIFSQGTHATVYRMTPEEQKRFGHADLVREEMHTDKDHFLHLFYGYKISALLFPDNFLHITGGQRDSSFVEETTDAEGERYAITRYNHRLFSVEAAVPSEHTDYAAHMDLYTVKGMGFKESACQCEQCRSHEQFHQDNGLDEQAKIFSKEIRESGISLPVDDPSDYCLTQKGILFFEIEKFAPSRVLTYLEGKGELSQNERRVHTLTKRYQAFLAKAGRFRDPFTGQGREEWDTEDYIV